MAGYDDFAWFYHRYWNEEFHGLAFPILERIWLSRVPAGARILDVCCGTGYLAGLLAARGHYVTGFDASAAMIGYARQSAPEAEFSVADAARFRLPAEFDAAVCTFDSLNHLLVARGPRSGLQEHRRGAQAGRHVRFRRAAGGGLPDPLGGIVRPGSRRSRADHHRVGIRFPQPPGPLRHHHVPSGGRRMATRGRGDYRAQLQRRRKSTRRWSARDSAKPSVTTQATWAWPASLEKGAPFTWRRGCEPRAGGPGLRKLIARLPAGDCARGRS